MRKIKCFKGGFVADIVGVESIEILEGFFTFLRI